MIFVAGGDVDIPAGDQADAVVVINGSATVAGTVNALVVFDGTASLAGATLESLIIVNGTAELGAGTTILGDVGRLGSSVQRADGVEIGGTVRDHAVRGGRSVATSMGMTPLEGLVMGTRSGSVDPGILLALLRDGIGAEDLAEGLTHRSGLLALAETADVRRLLADAEAGSAAARLALDVFAPRAAAEIAGVATALERLDALVFTGGIGANAGPVRAAICRRLGPLGVVEPSSGARVEPDRALVSNHGPAVVGVRAREDLVIARETAARVTKLPA